MSGFSTWLRTVAGTVTGFCPFLPDEEKRRLRYALTRSSEAVLRQFGMAGTPEETAATVRDMKRALRRYGMYYEEYCLYDCAGKGDAYLSSFLTETGRYRLLRQLNAPSVRRLFADKRRVWAHYREFFRRDVLVLGGRGGHATDREAFFAFAAAHPTFFVKPSDGSCGEGVRRVTVTGEADTEQLFRSLAGRGYLIEERVCQHAFLSRFYPGAVNTVRYVTVVTGDARTGYTVHPFYPFLRFGRGGAEVDNGGAGGLIVPVNAETGVLSDVGRDETGRWFRTHPDSGVPFAGSSLPDWDGAKQLAERLALVTPEARCIGWDLALTPEGWVMVEGNAGGQFLGQQMVTGDGHREELSVLTAKMPKK